MKTIKTSQPFDRHFSLVLNVAKTVLEANSSINARLGGSLLLYSVGLVPADDVSDIDIIVDTLDDLKLPEVTGHVRWAEQPVNDDMR